MRGLVVLLGVNALALSACSWQGSLGPPVFSPAAPVVIPPGDKVIEPNGAVIEPAPIETVVTGLGQAQAVRAYIRQLSH